MSGQANAIVVKPFLRANRTQIFLRYLKIGQTGAQTKAQIGVDTEDEGDRQVNKWDPH